jgi:ANTAR domain-containing protein
LRLHQGPFPIDDDRLRSIRLALARHDAAGNSWCRAAMEIVAVSGTGITLGSARHSWPMCATSATVSALEELQFTLADGPGREAFERQVTVVETDLGRSSIRWPGFAASAQSSGFRAVFAYPLNVAATSFGVLTLYQHRAGPLTAAQDSDSRSVAAIVARTLTEHDVRIDDHRALIHQAAGMLAVQLAISVAEALGRLRAQAVATRQPISQVAAQVVGRNPVSGDRPTWPDPL